MVQTFLFAAAAFIGAAVVNAQAAPYWGYVRWRAAVGRSADMTDPDGLRFAMLDDCSGRLLVLRVLTSDPRV